MSVPVDNPYDSPVAEPFAARPQKKRLPLGKLLLGLLVIPPSTTLASVLLAPLLWLAQEAQGYLTPGDFVYFFYDWQSFIDGLAAGTFFASFNTVAIAMPMLLVARRYRRLSPGFALRLGGAIAIVWWGLMTVVMAYATLDEQSNLDDSYLVAQTTSIVFFAVLVGLDIPLPLFAGFAVYAWWVRRLENQLDSGDSGDA